MEEAEDVYRFQELETEDVKLEPDYQQDPDGKHFNPDELYFNDMDLRAWEARTAEIDGMAYGEDYGYQEDEGYYEEAGRISMSTAEYEEFLFLRVLDKIRLARATGDQDVQLTTEELDAYSRGLRPRAPAARPQPRGRPLSAPVMNGVVNGAASNAIINTSTPSVAGGSGTGSTRRKKSQQRTSIFAPWPKKDKDKPSSRKRAPSNVSETTTQPLQPPLQQPPGFVVPGPNGPVYAPINAYGRMRRDSNVRSAASPSRDSRSASLNSRHAPTPPRVTPPREIPGAFPSGSPQRYYRESTPPPRQSRPPSAHSRYSMQENSESQLPPNTRSRSSSIQQPVKLVPFPVTDYQHYTAEPYQYHVPGQPAPLQPPSQPISQLPYARRVVSGPVDGNYVMPRRVPVPVQRATAPLPAVQPSYSDPALAQRGSVLGGEASDDNDLGSVMVDVVAQADDKSYKVQTTKPSGKEASSSGSAKDSDRRKRSSGRTRRKN
ncbi:hypothetical protein K505DRAFT_358223 [Melanomma pulvis-pyrius CBS 109.77]|uniref:Uncharacterized protein n=1 Tax=Melanomma pulvis-pyrius CBS 109.77 TaxID=1314802 RepID=A0A6A6XM80_9PLEO|nr:hypothetical protein K505DRAFT_358223 [Melanomma pulvis-pyrius CBS 109.77]